MNTNETKPDAIDSLISAPKADSSITDTGIETDMLGGSLTIGGVEIRPLTLATIALLRQINSPLIKGGDLSQAENVLLDIMILVVLQTVPLKESVRLALKDREGLTMKAFELAATISPNQTKGVIEDVVRALRISTETKVMATNPHKDAAAGVMETERGNDSSPLG